MNSLKDIFTDVLLNFSLQSKTQIWKEQRVTVTLLYFIIFYFKCIEFNFKQ